jgi:hypothetical protein
MDSVDGGTPFWYGIGYIIVSIGVAKWAASRGRSGFLWFLITGTITPVLAAPLILLLPDRN